MAHWPIRNTERMDRPASAGLLPPNPGAVQGCAVHEPKDGGVAQGCAVHEPKDGNFIKKSRLEPPIAVFKYPH
jgi:hypothetical protein